MNPTSAAAVFERLRGKLNVNAVHAGARRPFKFFLAGDPALTSALRSVLLAGQDGDSIPPEAAAAFEENCRKMYAQMARIAITPSWVRFYDFGAGRMPRFLKDLADQAQN